MPVLLAWDGVEKIKNIVCVKFNIEEDVLTGRGRSKTIALARHIAVLLMRDLLQLSWPELGRVFARDHTTVMLGYRALKKRLSKEPELGSLIASLKEELSNGGLEGG